MLHVVICDDDRQFALRLKEAVEAFMQKYELSARVDTFCALEEIGEPVSLACDAAFLDIDFAGKEYNGIDIARRLRTLQSDAVIVFVTNYVEFAPAGYEVRAFRYLLKNEVPQKLEPCLWQILGQIQTAKSDIKIQADGETVSIRLQELLYIESLGHTLIFHVAQKGRGPEKQYSCYATLTKMEVELRERGFLRIHKSYLVNMEHISKLNCRETLLDNGKELPMSSKNYSENKKRYMQWRGRR